MYNLYLANAKFYLENAFVEDVQFVLDEMKQSKYNEKNLAFSNSEKMKLTKV